MKPIFIGIHARKGSGKSTAAKVLIDKYNFKSVKMADPLKNMVRSLLSDVGMSSIDIEKRVEGTQEEKEILIPELCNTSGRRIMETLGTEWRDYIDPTLWVNIAAHRIQKEMEKGNSVICDDIRFQHEIDVLNKLITNRHYVKIIRSDLPNLTQNVHASEIPLKDDIFDTLIYNNSSVEEFTLKIDEFYHSSISDNVNYSLSA